MDEQALKNRRVYGKGFVDGMKAAEEKMGISAVRAAELEQGLNGIQRKVLDNLSMQESMAVKDVCAAIYRATRSHADMRIVEAALHGLAENGLAKRTGTDRFQRIRVKEQAPDAAASNVVSIAPAPADQPPAENSIQAIRRISGEIVERLDQIETVALDIERDKARAEQRNQKAAQLRELLKDL